MSECEIHFIGKDKPLVFDSKYWGSGQAQAYNAGRPFTIKIQGGITYNINPENIAYVVS